MNAIGNLNIGSDSRTLNDTYGTAYKDLMKLTTVAREKFFTPQK